MKTWFRKAQFIWILQTNAFPYDAKHCRVNSICFDGLSSDRILLHKTWDYRAWIDNYNSSKCILIWCKTCRVCELNKCELSFNQELSYWDNKQHCIRWLMHYNHRVFVYINKVFCNKNNVETYSGIKPKNKVLHQVEEKCPRSIKMICKWKQQMFHLKL